jgi:hypothetical protein
VFATALFYGDSMITPAISVLSAVEGLHGGRPGFDRGRCRSRWPADRPVRAAEARHRQGGALFGPVMLSISAMLATLGVMHIFQRRRSSLALNPWYALNFFITDKWLAFLALGSVVLAVTGPRRSIPTWAISARADAAVVVRLRHAVPAAQLLRAGRDDPRWTSPRRRARSETRSSSSPRYLRRAAVILATCAPSSPARR